MGVDTGVTDTKVSLYLNRHSTNSPDDNMLVVMFLTEHSLSHVLIGTLW